MLINEIATDKQVKDFTKLKINDEIFIEKLNDEIQIKKFDEDFYVDVLKVKGGEYVFEKEKENLDRVAYFKEFIITDSLMHLVRKAGVPDSVLGDLVYIFGWDIDYAFDIRNGDKVKFFMKISTQLGNRLPMVIFCCRFYQ